MREGCINSKRSDGGLEYHGKSAMEKIASLQN